jgi:hypothetical protein
MLVVITGGVYESLRFNDIITTDARFKTVSGRWTYNAVSSDEPLRMR